MSGSDCMLACGLVIDAPEDGTVFPSSGGNSSDPRIQAVYWRCVVALFASARLTNATLRLSLFTNAEPPEIGGVDVRTTLERYGVEIWTVPLSTRRPTTNGMWGNVLYFIDVLDALSGQSPDLRIALVDCDVVVLRELGPLFDLLSSAAFVGYPVWETAPQEDVNGLTLLEMRQLSGELLGASSDGVVHFGGELLMTTPRAWGVHRERFFEVVTHASTSGGPVAKVATEEHLFTIVFAALQQEVVRADAMMRRVWTGRTRRDVRDGDDRLLLWHLPGEKRYGLADLFAHLAARQFPRRIEQQEWRDVAGRICGIPKLSAGRRLSHGFRAVCWRIQPRRAKRGLMGGRLSA